MSVAAGIFSTQLKVLPRGADESATSSGNSGGPEGQPVVNAGYSRALFPLEKRVHCNGVLPGTQIFIYLDLPDDVLLQYLRTLGSLLANRREMNHSASIP